MFLSPFLSRALSFWFGSFKGIRFVLAEASFGWNMNVCAINFGQYNEIEMKATTKTKGTKKVMVKQAIECEARAPHIANDFLWKRKCSGHIRNKCTSIQCIYAIISWCSMYFEHRKCALFYSIRLLLSSLCFNHFQSFSLLNLMWNKDKFTHRLIQTIQTHTLSFAVAVWLNLHRFKYSSIFCHCFLILTSTEMYVCKL